MPGSPEQPNLTPKDREFNDFIEGVAEEVESEEAALDKFNSQETDAAFNEMLDDVARGKVGGPTSRKEQKLLPAQTETELPPDAERFRVLTMFLRASQWVADHYTGYEDKTIEDMREHIQTAIASEGKNKGLRQALKVFWQYLQQAQFELSFPGDESFSELLSRARRERKRLESTGEERVASSSPVESFDNIPQERNPDDRFGVEGLTELDIRNRIVKLGDIQEDYGKLTGESIAVDIDVPLERLNAQLISSNLNPERAAQLKAFIKSLKWLEGKYPTIAGEPTGRLVQFARDQELSLKRAMGYEE